MVRISLVAKSGSPSGRETHPAPGRHWRLAGAVHQLKAGSQVFGPTCMPLDLATRRLRDRAALEQQHRVDFQLVPPRDSLANVADHPPHVQPLTEAGLD